MNQGFVRQPIILAAAQTRQFGAVSCVLGNKLVARSLAMVLGTVARPQRRRTTPGCPPAGLQPLQGSKKPWIPVEAGVVDLQFAAADLNAEPPVSERVKPPLTLLLVETIR
ncbi:hypothetical protein KBY96_11430 [Cyanobium sp. ATX 6A2]|nr:hypothetical protein [Cyanobium sp. ATX 6A2]